MSMNNAASGNNGAPRTVAEALGQITWLFSQSPLHRNLKIADLGWSVMPPILLEQFRLFTFGPLPGLENVKPEDFLPGFTKEGLETMPLGVAFWGWLSADGEAKIEAGKRLEHADWKSGDRLWLLELITPYATPENRLAELMLADLLQGPFAGKRFSLHRTDPMTGRKDRITLGGQTPAATSAASTSAATTGA